MCTACILRTQRPGYSPKNTCHLTGCTAKQQSPDENNKTAFNLVLHCPYEQTMRCPLTRSAGNALSVVSWVMGAANRVKGRGVVILSVDATHLLMASEDSDVVGMKVVSQTPQGPQGLTCVFYEQRAKYSSSAADTLKLYPHIPGVQYGGC